MGTSDDLHIGRVFLTKILTPKMGKACSRAKGEQGSYFIVLGDGMDSILMNKIQQMEHRP